MYIPKAKIVGIVLEKEIIVCTLTIAVAIGCESRGAVIYRG